MYTLIFLSLIGCLPKMMGKQCLDKGKCAAFRIVSETAPSPAPMEISRDDTALEARISQYQLTERSLLGQTQVRETCRALHLAERTYVLTQKKWYHKPFKNYKLVENLYIGGNYEPCAEWEADETVELAAVYPSVENQTAHVPLQRLQESTQFPFPLLGLALLENPTLPTLHLEVQNHPKKIKFDSLLPERNSSWICETLPSLQKIVAAGTFETWSIHYSVANEPQQLPAVQSYIFENEPRLLYFASDIQRCNRNIQSHVKDVIYAAAVENPESYAHLNYLYNQLFSQKMKSVKRTKVAKGSKANASSRTSNQSNRSLVGTYQCRQSGQVAYLRVYRNGVFNLIVELNSGSAQGHCTDKACTIENINKSAVNFTGDINAFGIRRSGNAVLLNNSVRCEQKS